MPALAAMVSKIFRVDFVTGSTRSIRVSRMRISVVERAMQDQRKRGAGI
jgi:hypothetical protein